MNSLNFNRNSLEGWWNLLKHLSREKRIELASMLINSLKQEEPKSKKDSWEDLFGSWEDEEMSAEEMAKFIRDSRFSNRKIEPFD